MLVKATKIEKDVGKNVGFERIRRITGYLVGSMDKWNDAKKAEERDRVKHGLATPKTGVKSCK
ncbi:MAG: anaerobic ribonucleoside-triphosphate reductase [Ruthenibacterium sp.]